MKITAHPDVTAKLLNDGTLLLISPSGRVFRGNHATATVWQHLVDDDFCARSISGEAADARMRQHINDLITVLAAAGIIRTSS